MSLETHTLTGTSGEYTRSLWLRASSLAVESTLCVFLDAELYLHRLDAPALIDNLITSGALPPLTCVFVSNRDSEARHHDYSCNARYADFIATDVIGWVRARVPQLSAGGHVVCGLSLSGLASAFLAVSRPDVFSAALCQSPSFWWNDQAFSQHVAAARPHAGAYWISVGDLETETGVSHPPTGLRQNVSQMAACARGAEALQGAGNRVHYHVFAGGHEIPPWKAELPAALPWVIRTVR